MSEIEHVRSKKHPSTMYLQFEPMREQKDGKNSAGTVDPKPGFSPISRWMMAAFDYEDFASNPDVAGSQKVTFQLPTDTIALRALIRVDDAFDNADSVNVGDDDDANGWAEAVDLESAGVKYDPDAEFNPAGSTGFKYYEDGDTIDIETASGTAPTEGKGILAVEVISYHEDAEAEW